MEDFRNALDDCYLGDLGFTGPRFTWSNNCHNRTYTQERLDRALANSGWCEMYKSAGVEVMAARASNHHPLLVTFNTHKSRRLRGRRCFKFEASWILDEEYGQIIQKAWDSDGDGVVAMQSV
jgi:hypothetical protein